MQLILQLKIKINHCERQNFLLVLKVNNEEFLPLDKRGNMSAYWLSQSLIEIFIDIIFALRYYNMANPHTELVCRNGNKLNYRKEIDYTISSNHNYHYQME